jgi:cyanophycin synthetase
MGLMNPNPDLPARTRGMRVVERAVYRGPHLYGDRPMVRFRLDLGPLEQRPTSTLGDFSDRLLELLPSLHGHACSLGRSGGFVQRLREGTWIGHVVEHVAIELQALAGVLSVGRGKTRGVRGHPGLYDVLFEYQEPEVGRLAGRFALELVNVLLPVELAGVTGLDLLYADEPPVFADGLRVDAAVTRLKRLRRRVGLGPTTAALVAEAERRGIPVTRMDELSLVQLGWGARQKRIRASITGATSFLGVETAGDKALTKSLLERAGVPVPRGDVARTAEEAVAAAARLGGQVVTKPLDGNHGRGVTTGLADPEDVRRGFELAAAVSSRVVVEQQLSGRDHRILVVGGEVTAVAERAPAQVVGDGARTIRELVEAANADPRRGDGHEEVMTRIKLDATTVEMVASQGLHLDAVPEAGRIVLLKHAANLSSGGMAIDRTDEIHPENACLAIRAALTVGLDVAGIDFICPDISRPVRETGGGVVEVNAAPGLRMHLQPSQGRARNVARPLIRMLFPRGERGRIPVFAVTGTNGKSTTGRMLAHILRQTGLTVGLTNSSGVYVGAERVLKADATGPRSARMVLADPMVEAAVLEVARGGLLREGLAFDRCDVGAVTNIQPDHLGAKGVETVQDLAWVKSVVVEAVSDGGCSVLNADDVLTARMRRRAGGRIVLFSLRGGADMPEFLRTHIEDGGLAVVREPGAAGGELAVHEDGRRRPLMRASEIPATLGGLAEFNIANAMTAAAMAIGHGIPARDVRLALSTFGASFEQNPGRLNTYDGHGFRVIVDYAHNAAGLIALRDLLGKLRPLYGRQIGMVTVPGDRRDEDIRAMGEVAAMTFDHVVFREDPSRRGRAEGEIMELLVQGAVSAGASADRLERVADEFAAADRCMSIARPGDLVVLTPTEVEEMWGHVLRFSPTRTDGAEPRVQPLGAASIASAAPAHA